MTEYDYSPDAQERFQAKMAGVGDWVTQQKHHAPKYSNPFVTEPASSSTTPRSRTPPRAESSSRHYDDRPQPSRSRTLPAQIPAAAGYGHTSRAYAHAQQSMGDPSARHRSARSPQRSGSLPVDPRYVSTHVVAPMHPAVPRASPVIYAPPPPPPSGYRSRQVEYTSGQIVLPPPRHGEQYVIIPPKGRRIDIVTDSHGTAYHSRSQSTSRSTSRSTGSPTKKTNDAFLKRLLTTLTPNVEWGNSSGSRSSARTLKRDPSRRRSTSR
ncbi:hypothetical protein C2E23DRAFT_842302 [Lenzites betulinus]|nr:hypothetical protein C2E23DRAFT_842302 [Lenzites betulinus]